MDNPEPCSDSSASWGAALRAWGSLPKKMTRHALRKGGMGSREIHFGVPQQLLQDNGIAEIVGMA